MTSIDFYTHVADRLDAAVRVIGKAYAAYGSVRVLTPDRATTDALDRLLWVQSALSFLPHCRMDSAIAAETPIWIDEALEHAGPAAVLVNLNAKPAPFFSRFERLAEIVGTAEADVVAARERFRFYRERGYELRSHNLAGRGA